MRRLISCVAAWAALALPALAHAGADGGPGADFPALPIRWIVPFPPAGSIDAVARVVGRKLSQVLGQQIIIDNRAGAGGRVGAKAAADARPDGYTQLFTLNTTYTIKKDLFRNPTFDPDKDFEPITIVAETSQLLVASPKFPAHDVRQLIDMARKHPHEINFASSGVGGSLHLAMLYFESQAGIDLVHIPYKGGPPAVNDLMTDRVSLMFFNTPAALSYVKNHQLQALGVSTPKRSMFLPDVPTIAESGVPGFDISVWFGLSVPAGTPKAVVERMHAAVAQALADPGVRHDLIALGAEPVGDTPADFAQRMRRESEAWTQTFKQADMVLE
ncbi:Bug family tripartite tricarboxylate transporter substrate binding protein [Achromobacter aloeverae]|uniref:Bug family tripartite tricarboxylate transporter substrate binding protein n=1 Tax=Achromobacter aloeverae TaxID=1750518 RepID=UPI00130117DE|nr:tripartite tricarboxylate transporter substrate binding protein [Achromobacter aloeverae]